MTKDRVVAALRAACAEAGSQQAWASKSGLSIGYVCNTLKGRRKPGAKLLAALGIERVVTYRRIGPR